MVIRKECKQCMVFGSIHKVHDAREKVISVLHNSLRILFSVATIGDTRDMVK